MMKHHPVNGLTDDLLIKILSQLSVKSLLRFKCVSKAWHALTSDGYYRKKLPQAMSGLFYNSRISGPDWKFVTEYIGFQSQNDSGSMDTSLSFLPPHQYLRIEACCNGLLLCYSIDNSASHAIYVCNPVTRTWAVHPRPHEHFQLLMLAFNPHLSRHYNVVSFPGGPKSGVIELEILSSKTGKWVKSQIRTLPDTSCYFRWRGVFFDGIIHLLDCLEPIIVKIDFEGKVYRRIELPGPKREFAEPYLGQSGGHLHYALIFNGQLLVWVLENYDKNEWVLKHSISLEAILEKLRIWEFHSSSQSYYSYQLDILAFHPDLDVIFLEVGDLLLSYHLISANLLEICSLKNRIPYWFIAYSPCLLDDLDL